MNIVKFILAVVLFPIVWLISNLSGDRVPFVETYRDFWKYYVVEGKE